MGRLEEKFRDTAVSRFDLVLDSSHKGSTSAGAEKDELSLSEWYGSCQSGPGASSHDFFCREWPESAVFSSLGLRDPCLSNEGESADQSQAVVRRGGAAAADEGPTSADRPEDDAAQQGSRRSSQKSSSSSGGGEGEESLLLPPTRLGVTRFVPPLHVSQHVRDEYDAQFCFTPAVPGTAGANPPECPESGGGRRASDPQAPLSRRQKAEEGLYTGSLPYVAPHNLTKMINRLTVQGNREWVEGGGAELLQESPLEDVLYRRPHRRLQEQDVPQLTTFVQASTSSSSEFAITAAAGGADSCFLQLHVSQLQFLHHPLQSAEQVLSQGLVSAVAQYTNSIARRETDLLWDKIRVLRSSMSRLEQLRPELGGPSSNIRGEVDYNRRSRLYRTTLRSTRQELHTSAQRDRQWLTEALTSWSKIKELRETQGYTTTPIVLAIRKMETGNVETEMRHWQEALDAEVSERWEAEQLRHQEALVQHEAASGDWRSQRKARKAAVRRQQLWAAEGGTKGGQAAALQAARDQLALNTPWPPKPVPPAPPATREQVQAGVSKVFTECHRPPGEPLVHLSLATTGPVTSDGHCPLQERRRRQAVARTSVAVKMIINKKVVTQSAWCSLDDVQWCTDLNLPVYASLSSVPRTLTLHLLEGTAPPTAIQAVGAALRTTSIMAVATVSLRCSGDDGGGRGVNDDSCGGGVSSIGEHAKVNETAAWDGEQVKVEFSSDKVIAHSHAGVGAAVADSAQGGSRNTAATLALQYRLTTAGAGADNASAATGTTVVDPSLLQLRRQSEREGRGSVAAQFDPNDPVNARLAASLMQKVSKSKQGSFSSSSNNYSSPFHPPPLEGDGEDGEGGVFECDGESVGHSWFCSREELDSNLRLKMLQLRDKKVPEFQGLSRIPALSSQILRSTVWDYEAKQASSSTLQEDSTTDHDGVYGPTGGTSHFGVPSTSGCDDDWLDDVAERMAAAERLVSSVRRRLLHQTAEAAAVPTPADMVQEEQIPDIGTLGTSLVSVLRPKRPLKPERKVRGAVRGAGLTGKQVKLIVNVARAFNVPVRTPDGGGLDHGYGQHGAGLVRSFVTVQFQGRQSRTSVADGPNPTWNQQLVLPFRAPNDDYSSISLGLVRESIVLQLYDERLLHDTAAAPAPAAQDDDLLHTTRLHNTWLASLSIPTSALLHTSKIEGTFEVVSPVSVLGYSRASDGTSGNPASRPSTLSTHLTLYVTLEPTLPHPQVIKGLQPCPEPPGLVASSAVWQEALQSRYPLRHYQSHALTMGGQLVALHRLLRPLAPPPQLMMTEDTPDQRQCRVAWFVSLIPSLPDMSLFPGTPNITANSEQFISMLCGGEPERAMLLTNYFLHLGYAAYLLIGSSVCQGQYWCVLVRTGAPHTSGGHRDSTHSESGGEWRIWCPSAARSYSTRDPFCPVKAVYMLASPDNVWGSCQRYEDPARVQFSVSESSNWRALYSRPSGLPPLQPPSLSYPPPSPPPPASHRDMRDRLTVVVRDAFMKWRPHHRTVWNRDACDVLRGVLRRLETPRATGGLSPPPSTHLTRLHHSHSVCGVCIQQGWRGVAALLAAVHGSDVHSCTLPGVEFALAVHTHPYPAGVTSVWLYVASLVRRTI